MVQNGPKSLDRHQYSRERQRVDYSFEVVKDMCPLYVKPVAPVVL